MTRLTAADSSIELRLNVENPGTFRLRGFHLFSLSVIKVFSVSPLARTITRLRRLRGWSESRCAMDKHDLKAA